MIFNPPYNPKSVSSVTLKAWYRADQGITIATGVSQWNDLSGNGYHITQGTGANQPAFESAGFNGQASVLFNGTTHFLQNAGTMATDIFGGNDFPYSVYCVWRPISITGAANLPYSACSTLSATQYVLEPAVYTVGNTWLAQRSSGTAAPLVTGGSAGIGNNYITRSFYTGTNISLKYNTTAAYTNSSLNTASLSVNRFYMSYLNLAGSASFYNCRISELFIYNGIPNATEDLLLGNYLQNRYLIANG